MSIKNLLITTYEFGGEEVVMHHTNATDAVMEKITTVADELNLSINTQGKSFDELIELHNSMMEKLIDTGCGSMSSTLYKLGHAEPSDLLDTITNEIIIVQEN